MRSGCGRLRRPSRRRARTSARPPHGALLTSCDPTSLLRSREASEGRPLFFLFDRHPDHLRQVERLAVRHLLDLLAATEAVANDERVMPRLPHRRQENQFAAAERNVVMVLLESEA